jgi:hypothetical protein
MWDLPLTLDRLYILLNQLIQRILRFTQDKPFDVSI